MIYLEKYTGTKTYMAPNGSIMTPQAVYEKKPAAQSFTHYVETDASGEVMLAFEHLGAMRAMYDIDAALSEDEAIAAIEVIRNTPAPTPEPSAEERIAAAMEYQNVMNY